MKKLLALLLVSTSIFASSNFSRVKIDFPVGTKFNPNFMKEGADAQLNKNGWTLFSMDATATITIASPAVITYSGIPNNSLYNGQPVTFTTTGALPTGLTAGATYYVVNAGSSTINVSATVNGSAIGTTGTQSGTHTLRPLAPLQGGTGGITSTPTGLTFTRSTSSPLFGDASFLLAQTNSTVVAGEGLAYTFSISSGYTSQSMNVDFDYKASSTFVASNGQAGSASDLQVYIVDVVNGQLIPVSPGVLTATGNTYHYQGRFQPTLGVTAYQLLVFSPTASANATGWTFQFGDVEVTRGSSTQGAIVTDWVNYTPTIVGFGTPTGVQFKSRRVGDSLEVLGSFTSGTSTATQAQVNLGYAGGNGNVTIDTTKVAPSALIGSGIFSLTGTTIFGIAPLSPSTNQVYFNIGVQLSAQAATTPANGNAIIGSGSVAEFHIMVPIVGWTSNVQMSSDNPAQQVVFLALSQAATGTINGSGYNVAKLATITADSTGSYNTSTGQFNVPAAGFYNLTGTCDVSTNITAGQFVASRVGNATTGQFFYGFQRAYATTTNDYSTLAQGTVQASVNDKLEVDCLSQGSSQVYSTNTAGTFLTINRVPNPATVAASGTFRAVVKLITADQAIANSTNVTVAWNGVVADSTASYDTTNHWYRAQVAGTYDVDGHFSNSEVTATHIWLVACRKNTVVIYNEYFQKGGTATNSNGSTFHCSFPGVLPSDTLDVQVFQDSGSSLNVYSDATNTGASHVEFKRVGD